MSEHGKSITMLKKTDAVNGRCFSREQKRISNSRKTLLETARALGKSYQNSKVDS